MYGEECIGQSYNYYTVIGIDKNKDGRKAFICQCACGIIKKIKPTLVVKGYVKSCGCKAKELAKGINNSENQVNDARLYKVYRHMIERCADKDNKNYGGRNISVCDEWKNDYKAFEKWAYDNGYDINAKHNEFTIDRKDVNGNYTPDNCRWISMAKQQRNKRNASFIMIDGETKRYSEWAKTGLSNYRISLARKSETPKRKKYECFGEALCLKDLSKKYNLYPQTIAYRLKQGMSVEDAVTNPTRRK